MTKPAPARVVEPRHRSKPFHLQRYFSWLSLAGIVLVTACLFAVYRELTLRHLIEHEGRANADQTRALVNSVWERHRGFVVGSRGVDRESLLLDRRLPALDADVKDKMRGLQVAKVKLYNLDGLTVFSTDPRQIGEDKSTNAGLRGALAGSVVSDITYRDRFDAFEGTLAQRSLIYSYVPVRQAGGGGIEGVAEVYSDVTDLLASQTRAQWQVAALVLALLSTLYAFLLLVVRKADGIIRRQERERAAREEQVRHQAYHDPLTGLPNRAYFSERLGESIALAARHGHECALMFIDLDRFKIVNDSLGHAAGDELLIEAARRFQACLRECDLLFRMGGDEFTVILPRIASPDDGASVARRVQEAMARPALLHEHEVAVGATIGIAVYPGDGDRADELLKNADAAMYSAKAQRRGGYAFYRSEMNRRAMVRLNLEAELQRAFRDGEFTLHYQPRLDARTHRIVALEALLRWVSPTRGLVSPGDFIGVLEEIGLMNLVGEWVMRNACTRLVEWQRACRSPLRVSVNVSSVQFGNPHFVSVVKRVLDDTGVAADRLELELTESILIADPGQAQATIAGLKALGVRIAIDDFGTGYSSLNYLRHFTVDCLKIDRCFVSEVASSARDQALARAIVEMASALDIEVVAEGVETAAQAAFFVETRCRELQGFLFARPMPADMIAPLLVAPCPPRADAGPAVSVGTPAIA